LAQEKGEPAIALWVGRKMLKVFKFRIELGLLVLGLMTLMYVQHVLSLMPLHLSGEISSRPDADEALVSSANMSAIHVLVLAWDFSCGFGSAGYCAGPATEAVGARALWRIGG
jgi:hypothetical protein